MKQKGLKTMGKKTIKFNERENSSPDTFRDLSSIEDYFESMASEMNFDVDVTNTSALDSLMESMPEKCREDLNGNKTETKMSRPKIKSEDFKACEGNGYQIPYHPEFQFYLDDLNRLHFRDTMLGDLIVYPNLPLNMVKEEIDPSTMCDLLDSIYLDLISTRTPLVILNSEDCEKIMKAKGIFGVGRKEFKQEFVLTDYSVKIQNTPIPNYLILGFDANESARESFNKCIDKWISDGFTNAEIIYLLVNLVRIARENTFISSIDDDEYKFICEKYDNNIDPFFNAIANIIEKSDNKIIHDDNLLVSTFNIYDDIRAYAPDEEDDETKEANEGGASNDEEPFLDDAGEQQESSEGKRCDDVAQQEDEQQEEQEEITEEVETEVREDGLDLPEEDEEIDSIEIEEAEEDDMVVQVRRDDY